MAKKKRLSDIKPTHSVIEDTKLESFEKLIDFLELEIAETTLTGAVKITWS